MPILDNYYTTFGGIRDFADVHLPEDELAGADEVTFFTDKRVVDGYKALLKWLANRNNTVTGVKYKDVSEAMQCRHKALFNHV